VTISQRAESDRAALRAFAPTLVLLALAVLINYVDRGNLALAAPLLKIQWGTTASQLGILFSAFFWTYTALQFIMGLFVDRWGANRMMALGFLVWSLATVLTGAAMGFATLVVMRLLLGVGESVMFPACSSICAKYLPEDARGFAAGVVNASMRWGSAVGTFGGGLLIAKYGWRPTFIAIGLVGLLWLPAWNRWKPKGSAESVHTAAGGVPGFTAILRQRSFWGAAMGHFCANYNFYFLISWLPSYLVLERHLSMATMARTAGVVYMVDSLASVVTGWLTDRFIRGGDSPTVVRKWAMGVGFSLAATGVGASALASDRTFIIWLLICAVGSGAANSGTFAFAQTLAGPRAAGRWVGLQNGMANLAGIIGPTLSGFLVDWTGHFGTAFGITALVSVAGGLAWVFGVHRLEPVNWQTADGSTANTV
jgi:MFS family permease